MITQHDSGDSLDILRFIQEKSGNIKQVEILLLPFHVKCEGNHWLKYYDDISHLGLIVHSVGGGAFFIEKEDAELILNDGILHRMKIPIKLE